MKAQRRHELKENTLAKVITNAPTFWQESGGKFLAGLIVVLVIIILIQYRMNTKRQGDAQAMQEITIARRVINEEIQRLPLLALGAPQEMAQRQRIYFNEANDALSRAMQASNDPKLQAEALVAKGDLNWAMSSLPPVPGAATQPALQFREPKELLASAAEAYQAVLSSFPDQRYAAIAARFGLAAIAENRGEWDAARSQYEKLALETKAFPSYQQLASQRLNRLDDLRKPVILGRPTTMPDFTAPAIPAATQLTATPAGPFLPTRPATTQSATTRASEP